MDKDCQCETLNKTIVKTDEEINEMIQILSKEADDMLKQEGYDQDVRMKLCGKVLALLWIVGRNPDFK